ncbi:hypothetical protein GF402_00460 [Candidatus Fermentibacteria bacterium]|nr:hypothetical protein [Candidatus Fermentibacteria bacterium]
MVAYLVAAIIFLMSQGQTAPLSPSLDVDPGSVRTEASTDAGDRAEESSGLPRFVPSFSPFSIRIRERTEPSRVKLSEIIEETLGGILAGYNDWYVKPALKFNYFGLRYESSFSI